MTNEDKIRMQCADLALISDELNALQMEEAKLMVKIVAARGKLRDGLIQLIALNPPQHIADYANRLLSQELIRQQAGQQLRATA